MQPYELCFSQQANHYSAYCANPYSYADAEGGSLDAVLGALCLQLLEQRRPNGPWQALQISTEVLDDIFVVQRLTPVKSGASLIPAATQFVKNNRGQMIRGCYYLPRWMVEVVDCLSSPNQFGLRADIQKWCGHHLPHDSWSVGHRWYHHDIADRTFPHIKFAAPDVAAAFCDRWLCSPTLSLSSPKAKAGAKHPVGTADNPRCGGDGLSLWGWVG